MRICGTCSREYEPSSRHKDCPACRGRKQKTPCLGCGKLSHGDYKRCLNCHNKDLGARRRGSNHPRWKGGRRYKNGYIACWTPDRGEVFDHILVMEQVLNRRLCKGENVHHKNGIKDDNRPENLELWVRPQPIGIRASDAVRWALEILTKYGCNPDAIEDGQDADSNSAISTSSQTHSHGDELGSIDGRM